MSKVFFKTNFQNNFVEVIAGWNSSTRIFWLDIIDECDKSNIIYSSMTFDLHESDKLNTRRLRNILKCKNIHVPNKFWALVDLKEKHAIHNLGLFTFNTNSPGLGID